MDEIAGSRRSPGALSSHPELVGWCVPEVISDAIVDRLPDQTMDPWRRAALEVANRRVAMKLSADLGQQSAVPAGREYLSQELANRRFRLFDLLRQGHGPGTRAPSGSTLARLPHPGGNVTLLIRIIGWPFRV